MTDRARLLFVDQFGTIGGGQKVLLSLLRVAEQEFFDIGVLAPAGPLEEIVLAQFGGRIAYYRCEEPRFMHGGKGPADLLALFAYAWRFRKHLALLKQQDIIYVNGIRHLPQMLVIAPWLKAKFIYHIHLAHSRVERALIRLAARWPRTFRLVACSEFVAQKLKIDRGLCVIRNALDRDLTRREFVNRFTSPDCRMAVVGTLRPEKGQDIAIDVVQGKRGAALYLVGKNGDGAESWASALSIRHSPNVIFNGPTNDIGQCLDDLQIQFNLVPSRWHEAFGLVAIEGMACSCLTIVSGTGGLAEIAANTGAIIAKDRGELSDAIDELRAMSAETLAALARKQFEATQRVYGPEEFERQAGSLLRDVITAGRKSI